MATGIVRDTQSVESGEPDEEESTLSETAWSAGERLRNSGLRPHDVPGAAGGGAGSSTGWCCGCPWAGRGAGSLIAGELLAPRQMMRRNLATGGDPSRGRGAAA
ncbi:MAG: hypothetical protein U0667_17835 [Chloroflexota bacterium]